LIEYNDDGRWNRERRDALGKLTGLPQTSAGLRGWGSGEGNEEKGKVEMGRG